MPYVMNYEYSDETLKAALSDVKKAGDRALIERMVGLFAQNGLTIKFKHCFPDTPNAYWRILCFIKKSAESVIVNTRTDLGKEGVVDGLNLQVRIANQATLDGLSTLTEGIRRQILNGNDCRFCSAKCEGKRYVFSYVGVEYVKCQYLNSNFRLTVDDEYDLECVLGIVGREIDAAKKKPGRRG